MRFSKCIGPASRALSSHTQLLDSGFHRILSSFYVGIPIAQSLSQSSSSSSPLQVWAKTASINPNCHVKSIWSLAKFWAPPSALKKPEQKSKYGIEWVENYGWMHDVRKERMKDNLADEKEYADYYLRPAEKLFDVFQNEVDNSFPRVEQVEDVDKWGPYIYWKYTTKDGHQQLKRRPLINEKGEPQDEVLLDTEKLYLEYRVTGVGGTRISPCHNFVAYLGEPEKGMEEYSLYIKDLHTGSILFDEIIPKAGGIEWSADSTKIVYTRFNDFGRPSKVMVHEMGTEPDRDKCIFEELDDQFYLHVTATKDEAYIVTTASSKTSCEVHLIDRYLMDPLEVRLVQKREPELEYFVEHQNGMLYILHNRTESGNYCLAKTPIEKTEKENWEIIVPDLEDRAIEDMIMFHNRCVILDQSYGQQKLRIVDLENAENAKVKELPVPDWVRRIDFTTNSEFNSESVSFSASSPVHPQSIFQFNFNNGQLSKVDAVEGPKISEEYMKNLDDFCCQTEFVKSHDGVNVPLNLAYKKGFPLDGSSPALFLVYGAYGENLSLEFDPQIVPLLKRGWVIVYAHVRGGGELGRKWHRAGRVHLKPNSTKDAFACIDHIVKKGYTSLGQICLHVKSAGAVVGGGLLNRHPEYLMAAIFEVPFVDLWTCMSDPTLPLTTHEYDEWGNPSDPMRAKQMFSMCPYQSLRAMEFPPVFVSTGINDSRVPIWGPAKWVAKARGCQTGNAPIMLYTDFEGGHRREPDDPLPAIQYSYLLHLWEKRRK